MRPGWIIGICACLAAAGACRPRPSQAPAKVEDAWTPPQAFAPAASKRRPNDAAKQAVSPDGDDDPIAFVDAAPIGRAELMDLLIEGHGVGALEQLVVLSAARRLAAERGLTVTQAEVDAEYDRSLESLVGNAARGDPADLRRKAGEALLDDVLASRNLGRSEFKLVMRRNAYLRKIAAAEVKPTEAQVREEFERLYGERVEIRHIQLASRSDVDKVLAQRSAGTAFAELALRYSANRRSAENGGLLPPFSANDPSVPEPLRRAAFALPVGQDSKPIAVDGWYHLIRVERRIGARKVTLDEVRADVERSLRARLTDAQMQELYAALFREADIRIVDRKLRDLFFRKHPGHPSAPKE